MVYFCSAQMMLKKFTLRDLFSSDFHELSTKLPWMPVKVLKVHTVSESVLFRCSSFFFFFFFAL